MIFIFEPRAWQTSGGGPGIAIWQRPGPRAGFGPGGLYFGSIPETSSTISCWSVFMSSLSPVTIVSIWS